MKSPRLNSDVFHRDLGSDFQPFERRQIALDNQLEDGLDVDRLAENRFKIGCPVGPYGRGRHAEMLPVRKKLTDPLIYLEPRTCRCMMRLIGHDFMDSGNLFQAPHDRHDACDRDLSGEIAGGRIDGGEFYSRPHEVELLYGLPQKLVTVNQHKPLILVSTQA